MDALPEPPQEPPAPVRDADLLGVACTLPGHAVRYEENPQLLALTTAEDEPADWLRAGQALQRCLLTATAEGLSASFLYQAIERDDMREAAGWSWPANEHSQMIIRLGYGSHPARTPRRPLTDVLGPRLSQARKRAGLCPRPRRRRGQVTNVPLSRAGWHSCRRILR